MLWFWSITYAKTISELLYFYCCRTKSQPDDLRQTGQYPRPPALSLLYLDPIHDPKYKEKLQLVHSSCIKMIDQEQLFQSQCLKSRRTWKICLFRGERKLHIRFLLNFECCWRVPCELINGYYILFCINIYIHKFRNIKRKGEIQTFSVSPFSVTEIYRQTDQK